MSYSPVGGPPATSSPRSPSRTPCAGRTRPWASRPWARSAASRPGSCRSAATSSALIPAVPLPRKPTPELITVPGRLRGTIKAAEQILERTKADCVVGFGGYVALPGYLAAKRLGVPIVVHEANARPGLANKIGSRYAAEVAVSTPDSKLRDARYIGIPLRRSIATLDRAARPPRGARRLRSRPQPADAAGLRRLAGRPPPQRGRPAGRAATSSAPGSRSCTRSARRTNCRVCDNMPGMPPYIPVPYVDRMDLAYAAADMMLCRAGAMTVAELSAVGLPAAYVPLPIGNGEQRLNAQPVVKAGGGLLVDDAELTPEWVQQQRPARCWPTRTGCTRCPARPASSAAGTPTTCSSAWCTRRSPPSGTPLGDGSASEPHPGPDRAGEGRGVAGSTDRRTRRRQRGVGSGPPPRPTGSPRAPSGAASAAARRRCCSSVVRAARSGCSTAPPGCASSGYRVSGTEVLTPERGARGRRRARSALRWSPSTPTRSRRGCCGSCPGSTRSRSCGPGRTESG